MHKMIIDVTLFHQTFGHPVVPHPQRPPLERQELRKRLLEEEFAEGNEPLYDISAMWDHAEPDDQAAMLAELGDWLADMIYYLIGTALEYGLPLGPIWDEVQRSNMAKLWTEREIGSRDLQIKLKLSGWTATLARPQLPPDHPESLDFPCYQVKRADGKVEKPPTWTPPNIVGIIKHHIQQAQDAKPFGPEASIQ